MYERELMQIHNIQKKYSGTSVRVTADISFQNGMKETIYVSCDKKYASFLAEDATAFVATMLLPGLKEGESITTDAAVSKKFLDNTAHIMNLLSSWDPSFKKVEVSTKKVNAETAGGKAVGVFFSGGVDSFYTYLKHRKDITHFLLVHGFDIAETNSELFEKTANHISVIAKEEGKELITVKTNIRKVIEKSVLWDWGHGSALATIALLFRPLFGKVFIAGALSYDQLFPYGTHPELDPLWGTETLTLVHDGNERDRRDKVIDVISHSALALNHLHVCPQNEKGVYNCGKCFKCLWTKMVLICAGALSKAKTFDNAIDLELVSKMYYNYALNYHMQAESVLRKLQEQKREPELQQAILLSLKRSRRKPFKKKFSESIAKLDQKYNKRRLYRLLFTMHGAERNTMFKILYRYNLIK